MKKKTIIYHIVTLDDLKKQTKGNDYQPVSLKEDGFIHCTAEKSTSLLVLEDYFVEAAKRNVILILEIDESKLKSKVKYEAPAPIQGGGTTLIKEGILFPHIYGSLNLDAVVSVGKVERVADKFVWPSAFGSLKRYIQ